MSQQGIESSGGLRCWCTTILMLMEPIKSNYSCLAPSHQEHHWILMHGNSVTSLHQSNNTVTGGVSLNGDWLWGSLRFKVSWMCTPQHVHLCVQRLDQSERRDLLTLFSLCLPPLPNGLNLISTCMFPFNFCCTHTCTHTAEEPACYYHAGKHWLSLDYANRESVHKCKMLNVIEIRPNCRWHLRLICIPRR